MNRTFITLLMVVSLVLFFLASTAAFEHRMDNINERAINNVAAIIRMNDERSEMLSRGEDTQEIDAKIAALHEENRRISETLSAFLGN